uniref:Disease resistance protein n=1 Tax=Phaseolus vulgaris TaxID=3885 RepID=V7AH44_PHAVU|nr:hypothetical protein PHAVU_011G010300g [Phaseolus vulgaris]ESW03391.1 hypothetical protein PHAVU_011G010300g [Phaseolus vulgaris]
MKSIATMKMEKIGICYKISQRTGCQWLRFCTKPIYSLRINNFGLEYFPMPEASPICLPAIKSLEIEECPNLKSVLHKGLTIPNLQSLSLKSCSNLTEVPNSYPHLYFLGLLKCPKLDLFSYVNLPSKLDAIEIDPCETCIPQELELYSLYMKGGCTGLEILPLPTKIEFLAAKFMLCSSLENELKHLTATLTTIQIYSCPELHSLGDDLSQLEKLETIRIHSCPKLHSLPLLPSSLTFLRIEACPILAKKLLEEERTSSSLKIDIYS